MNLMEYLIGLDVGTMSMRSIIYDSNGKAIFQSAYEYHSIFTPPGMVEQNTKDWLNAVHSTLKETGEYVKERGIEISAIAVTSQRASVIPVDRDGNCLYNAVTWQDKRSVPCCEKLIKQIPMKTIYLKTGLRANPYFSLPKMLWFKENASDIYKKSYKLLGVQDYVAYLLTGRFVTDWTQAARTMLLNISTFQWDQDMLKASGIDERLLCELCKPGAKIGGLSGKLAQEVGMKEGIPVILSGGDQPNAALALNVLKPGLAEANTGTGSFVISYTDKPVFDQNARVLCSASAVPGKWIMEAGIFNTGAIYRWFRENFLLEKGVSFDSMNQEAQASPIGSNGVMLLPHFEGSMAPYWNPYAKGMFFNLSLGTKRGDMIRSIMEGIAMEIADNLSLIETISGKLTTVSVAGGMSKSRLFNDIQANVFNKQVICYSDSEASSRGAVISASVTLGLYDTYGEAFRHIVGQQVDIYQPNDINSQKYSKLRRKKRDLYNALNDRGIYQEFKNVV